MTLDYLQHHTRHWDTEEREILRKCIDRAHISMGTKSEMEGCDAWVEHSKTPRIKFAVKPTCSWVQVLAHELAHIIDWTRTGDGVAHSPNFFRTYRRILDAWFKSTETVQFVAIEKVVCDPDDADEANGPAASVPYGTSPAVDNARALDGDF